jgi:transcriptional regulator with XRE-family HTH domain
MTATELRAALKSLHLSQRSLAERLGVHKGTVNRWVTGELPVPQYAAYVLSLLARLAQ